MTTDVLIIHNAVDKGLAARDRTVFAESNAGLMEEVRAVIAGKPVLKISIPSVMTRLFILSEYDEERFRAYFFYVFANG